MRFLVVLLSTSSLLCLPVLLPLYAAWPGPTVRGATWASPSGDTMSGLRTLSALHVPMGSARLGGAVVCMIFTTLVYLYLLPAEWAKLRAPPVKALQIA